MNLINRIRRGFREDNQYARPLTASDRNLDTDSWRTSSNAHGGPPVIIARNPLNYAENVLHRLVLTGRTHLVFGDSFEETRMLAARMDISDAIEAADRISRDYNPIPPRPDHLYDVTTTADPSGTTVLADLRRLFADAPDAITRNTALTMIDSYAAGLNDDDH